MKMPGSGEKPHGCSQAGAYQKNWPGVTKRRSQLLCKVGDECAKCG